VLDLYGKLPHDYVQKDKAMLAAIPTVRSEIAAYALMVDAKVESAADFYQHHGFIALPETSRTLCNLFLPLATVRLSQNSPISDFEPITAFEIERASFRKVII
jgi:hypothetical protein